MSRDKEKKANGSKEHASAAPVPALGLEFDFASGDFMRPEEVARKLNISTGLVRKMLRKGKLPGFQLGRSWVVSKSALSRFLMDLVAKSKQDQEA